MTRRVFAIAAHPDDIEFQMAGTLVLLGRAGYEPHYMNIANGCCGTVEHSREEIIAIRRDEARAAAASIGAVYHESLVDDLGIFYEPGLLARVAAVMRSVAPEILLVQSPQDYMEDHQNAARLAVTAAFSRGMSNYVTDPPCPPVAQPVTVYHAQPHGNCGPLRQPIRPELFVDVTDVMAIKTEMLSCHMSQRGWLDVSQGMDAYTQTMRTLCAEVGDMSGEFSYAEGWRRRSHYGFGQGNADPLSEALGDLALTDAVSAHGGA